MTDVDTLQQQSKKNRKKRKHRRDIKYLYSDYLCVFYTIFTHSVKLCTLNNNKTPHDVHILVIQKENLIDFSFH